MSDSLFGPLMGELSPYLHFMSGFLESPLVDTPYKEGR